ncbi:hypothetical protein GCM10009840_17080 [Pseudolysinimonas kribbensis]|uniref:putative T7SS-secreted protein n=1 Tax=Pseudolysinimonas kribbensis TaxID=433641 RepID=UPI0031E1D293
MTRPSDWYLVDLEVDPTPGDAFGIRQVAQRYTDIAYVAANAASVMRGMRSSHSAEAWVGEAGDVFRSETDRMPGELQKADDSYSVVVAALSGWASALEDAQAQADRGLALAREAHADLQSAKSAYDEAQRSWSTAHAQQLSQEKLQKKYQDVPPPTGVTMPTDAQLRAMSRNVTQTQSSMDAASASIASANARIEAAKRLVLEAQAARDEAENIAVKAIGDAKGRAVKPSSVWEAIQDSAAWQAIVVIATVVLTIVSIVAIFVGGPIVWAIIAAATALLVLDALMSIAQGKNAWGELAMLAIGLIPGGKVLALIGLAAHVGGGLTAAVALAGAADRIAPSLVGATRSIREITSALRVVARADEGSVGLRRVVVSLAPRDVRFTQKTVFFEKIRGGRVYTFEDIVKSMKTDGWVGKPVDAVRMPDGAISSVDNTRVLAAHHSGVPIQARVHEFADPLPPQQLVRLGRLDGSAPTWGDFATSRIERQGPTWAGQNPFGSFDLPRLTGQP